MSSACCRGLLEHTYKYVQLLRTLVILTCQHRQEKVLLLKGMRLLELVLQRVGKNQLPVEMMTESDSVLCVPMVCECQC